jgi:hypothetical protein
MRRALETFRNNNFTEVIREEPPAPKGGKGKRPTVITAEETNYEPETPQPAQPAKPVQPSQLPVKKIAIVCIAVLCALGIFLGARALGGGGSSDGSGDGGGSVFGGEDVELQSVVVHTDIADNSFENAVILKVSNGKGNETLTNVKAKDLAQGVEFVAYGCMPAGEEGLMAGVWYSDAEPPGDDSYELVENSFDASAPQEFTQISARLLDHGDNVTMETGHDAGGYAVDWNDSDFARYQIEISNGNDISFASGQTMGVAVVYDGDQLAEGDIFYNDPETVNAGSTSTDAAVLPKNLANNDGVELMILPKY